MARNEIPNARATPRTIVNFLNGRVNLVMRRESKKLGKNLNPIRCCPSVGNISAKNKINPQRKQVYNSHNKNASSVLVRLDKIISDSNSTE